MATLDNSPSLFLGQSWETWAKAIEEEDTDEHDGADKDDKKKEENDSMRLRKEDMILYGQCPARDEFYLVVCEHCGQVIKPQALQRHIKHRHGNISQCENAQSRSGKLREETPPKTHSSSPISQKADMHGKSPHGHAKEKGLTKSASTGALSKQEKANAAQAKRNHTNPVVVMDRLHLNKNAQKNNGHSQNQDGELLEDGIDEMELDDEMEDDDLENIGDNSLSANTNTDIFDADELPGNSNNNSVLDISDVTEGHALHSRSQATSELQKRLERKDTLILQRSSPTLVSSTSVGSPQIKSSMTASPSSLSKSTAAKSSHSVAGPWMSASTPNINRSSPPLGPPITAAIIASQKSKASPTHHASKSAASKQLLRKLSKSSIGSKSSPLSKHSPLNTPTGSAPTTPMAEERSFKLGDENNVTISAQSPITGTQPPTSTTISPQGVIVTNTTLTNYKKMQKEKNVPCKDRVFDPDKHCGVWTPETQRPCTRSLTCKTHALSLRRSVKGRSKPFDHLLREHRAAKEIMLKEKADKLGQPIASKSASGTLLSSPVATVSSTALGLVTSPQTVSALVTSPVMTKSANSGHAHKVVPVSPAQRIQPKVPLQKLIQTPHTRPTALPVFPKDEPIQLPESGRLSSDGEDDEDDSFVEKPVSYLPYHPRPAAVNPFGGWLHGRGCYVFNRKEDLYRTAFMAAVERHLHPPPHKKLCVESKLPKGSSLSTNTKDPYDFGITSSDIHGAHAAGANAAANATIAAARLVNKQPKPKPIPPVTSATVISAARPTKPKEGAGIRSTIATNALLSKVSTAPVIPGATAAAAAAAKRKRSGSSPGPGGVSSVGLPGAAQVVPNSSANPISIAIPSSCISLNLSSATLSNINATVTTNKGATQLVAGKNNLLKDLSIVVTNIDSTASILNGHFVSLPGTDNVTHIHLNSLKDATKGTKLKGSKTIAGRPSATKTLFTSNMEGYTSHMNTIMTAIPVTPDSAIPNSVLNTVTAPIVSHSLATASNGSATTLTSPHPSPAPSPHSGLGSGSASPLVSVASPLANGLTTHTIKGFTNISHLPAALAGSLAGIPSPTDGINPLGTKFTLQTGKPTVTSRGINKPGTKSTTLHAATAQQLAAAALNLAPQQGNKLLTTNALNQVYSAAPVIATTGSPFTNLHRQPKLPNKAVPGSQTKNVPLQPMSLTIVAPSTVPSSSTTPQPTHLVLQSDSSPSNVLS